MKLVSGKPACVDVLWITDSCGGGGGGGGGRGAI